MNWLALSAALAPVAMAARVPFVIGGCAAGSVAIDHLPALDGWPGDLRIDARGVTLACAAELRDARLAVVNAELRRRGLVRGWRDETFAVVDPGSGQRLARIERAAARFWGTLTLGAHVNGHVTDDCGRPTALWVAQRSDTKPTDPGLLDNLVGGGVPDGQTPWQALVREGWEEAGLTAAQMQAARPGRVIRLQREIPEGLQVEDLHVFDLALPASATPVNQDGEVQYFTCLPVPDALALAAGRAMTVDAALVTLDFALRHDLLPAADAACLAVQLAPMLAGSASREQGP